MIQVNPPASIEALSSLEVTKADERLSEQELASLTIFSSEMSKAPAFGRLPGSTILRKFSGSPEQPEVVVQQGDPGATAFYILTSEDVIALRTKQIELAEQILKLRQLEEAPAGDRAEQSKREEQIHVEMSRLADGDLQISIGTWQKEIGRRNEVQSRRESSAADDESRIAARVVIEIPKAQKKFRWRNLAENLKQRLTSGRRSQPSAVSHRIPVDAAVVADEDTRTVDMFEGELFGEMSCMNRAPRSATVVAVGETYMLEMLRNVVDSLYTDKKFRTRMDSIYRERVLSSHLESLPIFEMFDKLMPAKGADRAAIQEQKTAFLADLRGLAKLETIQWGDVVFEEREPGNAVYIVRSGLLQVIQNGWTHLSEEDLSESNWLKLEELADQPNATEARRIVVQAIREILQPPKRRKPALPRKPGASPLPSKPVPAAEPEPAEPEAELPFSALASMLELLNTFIREWDIQKGISKKRPELAAAVGDPQFTEFIQRLPEDLTVWSDYDQRLVRRELLTVAFRGGVPPQASRKGHRRVVRYMGPGDIFGEIGVVEERSRTMTCVVYVHPESQKVVTEGREVPSRAELVRIDGEKFRSLCNKYPVLLAEVQNLIRDRQKEPMASTPERPDNSRTAFLQAPEFDELGLIQGQQLMLIDLDRCTRCNACVDACADAHSDGYSRLYLDGPRVQNHLVPLTCRSCLDPLCMIGCPVGAINRGSNGQIEISDWCIGCRRCEEQCPYNSIQMHELPLESATDKHRLHVESSHGHGVEIKEIFKRAVVCDLCSSTRHGEPACVHFCPHDAAFRVNAVQSHAQAESDSN